MLHMYSNETSEYRIRVWLGVIQIEISINWLNRTLVKFNLERRSNMIRLLVTSRLLREI